MRFTNAEVPRFPVIDGVNRRLKPVSSSELLSWAGLPPVCDGSSPAGMKYDCLEWWAQQDSNLRHADYESAALPTELWALQASSVKSSFTNGGCKDGSGPPGGGESPRRGVFVSAARE